MRAVRRNAQPGNRFCHVCGSASARGDKTPSAGDMYDSQPRGMSNAALITLLTAVLLLSALLIAGILLHGWQA